jgi:hypothetical protein
VRSVADCKAAAIWRANTLCEKHGIIKPRVTYNLRGTDAGQAFLEQNRIDLNLLLFRENCDFTSSLARPGTKKPPRGLKKTQQNEILKLSIGSFSLPEVAAAQNNGGTKEDGCY